MTALLISAHIRSRYGARIAAAVDGRMPLEIIALPMQSGARLSDDECARIELAYFSRDIYGHSTKDRFEEPYLAFFDALERAPGLKWLHVMSSGTDRLDYRRVLARGVSLTNCPGLSAVPVAHTAITGLLMLSRGFTSHISARARRSWEPLRADRVPADLEGQKILIVGLGAIGLEVARLAKALGLYVIGVRRGTAQPGDPVDELHPPQALPELLARCDWLLLACPLNDRTRGLIDAQALARMPRGSRLINIARGEIIDEKALCDALASGHLGGAHLDVFHVEPLPQDSPLWDMPNVIITPHGGAASNGNERRVTEVFLRNLAHFAHARPLENLAR